MPPSKVDRQDELEWLVAGPCWSRLPRLDVVAMSGGDREKFLNSFCTNDVRKLATPGCCEAFVLDNKGRTVGHVWIVKREDQFRLVTIRGYGHALIQHLDTYLIREDVTFEDESAKWSHWFVLGRDAIPQFAAKLGFDDTQSAVAPSGTVAEMLCARVQVAGPGWLITAPAESADQVEAWLSDLGWNRVSTETVDVWRIRSRTPWFGQDITPENLPQEIDRDADTICFEKGCYLGQETVARIDSLGHVNRLLRVLNIERAEPVLPGQSIEVDGRAVAKVTSVAWDPIRNHWIALAYVRRDSASPGRELGSGITVA